jgi:DNA-binding MarR family transcriptional regulator
VSRDLRQPRSLPPSSPNTGTLLLEAYRAFESELFEALSKAGHGALRPKHGAVLANVTAEGSRLTDLAEAGGMRKPSMKELVDELIELGYVERLDDERDRRARRIVLTQQGHEIAVLARKTIEEIEKRYLGILGKRAYGSLRGSLNALLARKG